MLVSLYAASLFNKPHGCLLGRQHRWQSFQNVFAILGMAVVLVRTAVMMCGPGAMRAAIWSVQKATTLKARWPGHGDKAPSGEHLHEK